MTNFTPFLPVGLGIVLRWARQNGWRPRYPRARRDGLYTWQDSARRFTVMVHASGEVTVLHRLQGGHREKILYVKAGCWQHVIDSLTTHSILPPQFNTAYRCADGRDVEWQWGVRTVYTDGSQGIVWSSEDEARAFLALYAEVDFQPQMRVAGRDLVRRLVYARPVQVVPSQYMVWRGNAAQYDSVRRRAAARHEQEDRHVRS